MPAAADVRDILKGYVSYELPFGRGKRFLSNSEVLDKLFGGWNATTLVHYTSGAPLFIYAANPYPYISWAGVYPNVNLNGNFSRKFHSGSFVPVTSATASSANKYFDGTLFSQPAFGQLGTGPEAQPIAQLRLRRRRRILLEVHVLRQRWQVQALIACRVLRSV